MHNAQPSDTKFNFKNPCMLLYFCIVKTLKNIIMKTKKNIRKSEQKLKNYFLNILNFKIMKTKKLISAMLLIMTMLYSGSQYGQTKSQEGNKPVIGVLNIDVKGVGMQPDQMGNLVRLELEKIDTFDVIDRYDAVYLIEKNNINISNCYGKICLVEKGKILNADKMIGGSVEAFNEIIVVTLKLINVKSGVAEKTQVKEFLYLPNELQSMMRITLREMMGLRNDPDFVQKLTKKFDYENLTNNPSQDIINLNGPRLGFMVYTGKNASYIKNAKDKGGFNAFPMMFQFGYQFEKKYLNEGNVQALFEFIPTITGLDQGFFIPSFTILHGLRSNKFGLEFAFGPTFGFNTYSTGYEDNGKWVTKRDSTFNNTHENIYERIDSKGDVRLSTGFIFAFGKTFKSGKLNIPINIWIRPDKYGCLFGASFGFNAKKKKQIL